MILAQLAAWFESWIGLGAITLVMGAVIWHRSILHRRLRCIEAAQKFSEHAAQTDRKRAEQAVQHRNASQVQFRVAQSQQRHLENILNAFNDAVLVTDTFNEVTLANDAATRLLEMTDQAIHARPVDEVVRDPALVKLIKDTREGGKALRKHSEHQIKTRGRTGVYDVAMSALHSTSDPLTSGDTSEVGGTSGGVVTILRDVTRQKEIDTMKSEFVSNVSHELRTPLASIQAYLEMLLDGEVKDQDARNEFYQIMQYEAGRLARLIDTMLNLSRLEAGITTIHRQQIHMVDLVRSAVDLLQPQAAEKRIELTTELSKITAPLVGDRDMIFQVLVNLIGNAIKYTPADGTVTIRTPGNAPGSIAGGTTGETSGGVSVSVIDSGVGIAEEDIPRLFDKFFRVQSQADTVRGTGLGLSLVRRIVEGVHHGKIEVKSTPGQGSTFTFTLPIAEKSIGGLS